jgi:hypothetical protein
MWASYACLKPMMVSAGADVFDRWPSTTLFKAVKGPTRASQSPVDAVIEVSLAPWVVSCRLSPSRRRERLVGQKGKRNGNYRHGARAKEAIEAVYAACGSSVCQGLP